MIDAADELLFLPLGGAGEIGMNLSLYGYGPPERQRWLMIDCGVSFGADIPGVDVLVPDPAWIAERRDQLEAIVLTHAHEDHLGAVAHLWPRLRCPVYATPFTALLLTNKLMEAGIARDVRLLPLPEAGRVQIGPFAVEPVGITHSIPESQSIALHTPLGTIVHSGDWKLDPAPVVGSTSDEGTLRELGDDGVLALICDSTNVFVEGTSGSEGSLRADLGALIAQAPQRVLVTCFGSNVARLHTLGAAARDAGRDVVIAGASLRRTYAAARTCGYLDDLPPFLDADMVDRLLPARTLIIATGGQGEPQAALARIAADEHPFVELEAGDWVIFSSRVIPGNELAIGRLHNTLLRQGIEVKTHRDGLLHVSGHPARGELARMYELVRPRIAVPVHGELRHMLEHARFARAHGASETIVAENGTMVRLAPGPAAVVDHVPSGRLSLEGKRTVRLDGELVRGRLKAIYNGSVVVTIVVNSKRPAVRDVQLSSTGLLDTGEGEIAFEMCSAVRRAVENIPQREFGSDDTLRETARVAVRRAARRLVDRKPVTQVHLVRV